MISSLLQFLFTLLITPLFIFVLCAELPLEPKWISLAVGSYAVCIFIAAVASIRLGLILLGFSILALPFFGKGAIGLAALACLWGLDFNFLLFSKSNKTTRISAEHEKLFFGSMLWIVAVFSAALLTIVLDFDGLIISSVLDGGSLSALKEFLAVNRTAWFVALSEVISVSIAVMLMFYILRADSVLKSSNQDISAFYYIHCGLAGGAIVCALVCALQILDIHPFVNLNRGGFWMHVGRYSGTLSDPNAFGVMAGLLAPFFLLIRKRLVLDWLQGVGVVFIAAAVWSGSRTFILLLLLWFIVVLMMLCLSGLRKKTIYILLGSLLCAGVFALCVGEPTINTAIQKRVAVPSVARTLQTLNWQQYSTMLESREIYWRIAYAVWKQSPIVGIGLGRFIDAQSAVAAQLGIDIGNWRDNANNFYLQVLAEQGLLGLLILVSVLAFFARAIGRYPRVAVTSHTMNSVDESWFRLLNCSALVVVLIALITGPHIKFTEVQFVLFIFLGGAVASSKVGGGDNFLRNKVNLIVLFALLIPTYVFFGLRFQPQRSIRGIYQIENEGSQLLAWTAQSAEFPVCNHGNQLLTLRALNPDIAKNPVWLSISSHGQGKGAHSIQVKLVDSTWRDIELAELIPIDTNALVKLNVDRAWSPAENDVSNDVRWLGVQLKWPISECSTN